MTITIDLPPEVHARAEAAAHAAGLDVETWLRHLAELALERPAPATHHTGTTTFEAEGFGGIEQDPGMMGGDARIIRTRIPVWLLVGLRRDGMSDADLLENYPSLTQADLNQAWGYVRVHQAEIERALREQQEA